MELFSPHINVIGSVNVDYTTVFKKLPEAGETVAAESMTVGPGGKGANQAVAAARAAHISASEMNCSVSMVGAVGNTNPDYRTVVEPVLREAQIDLDRLKEHEGVQTGTATILVNDEGENRIMVVPGANHQGMQPRELNVKETANIIPDFVQVFVLQGEIPFETCRGLFEQITKKRDGKLTELIFNPSPVSGIDLNSLRGVSVLVLNEGETNALLGPDKKLAGSDDSDSVLDLLQSAALRLHKHGIRNVVITRGKQGVFCSTPSGTFSQGSVEVPNVVDTTCAGDTFTGYLATELARFMEKNQRLADNEAFEHACRRASRAAAECIQHAGAMKTIPWGWKVH